MYLYIILSFNILLNAISSEDINNRTAEVHTRSEICWAKPAVNFSTVNMCVQQLYFSHGPWEFSSMLLNLTLVTELLSHLIYRDGQTY